MSCALVALGWVAVLGLCGWLQRPPDCIVFLPQQLLAARGLKYLQDKYRRFWKIDRILLKLDEGDGEEAGKTRHVGRR